MSGKVTSIEGIVPDPKLRQVVSYELSPLFTRSGQSERYNPDDLVSTRGLRIYKQMMADEQVKAVMVFKRDAITSRGWTFTFDEGTKLSKDEQQQRLDILDKCIRKMSGSFEDALNCVAKGRTYGYSLTEIVHDNITVDGKQYVGINSLRSRDASTFFFYTDPYGLLQKCVQRVDNNEIKIDLRKFIHYVHSPEEDQYYGQSDLRQAYRSWYVKDQVIHLYGTYLERFAGGFAALELQEGNTMVPGSASHETLKDVLRNLRNMAGIILPPNVKLNVIQPGNTPEYREALTYFDLAIAKALLVPNLLGLSHTGSTGAYAQSQTQLEAFFWTINADTRRLEAVLNEQLFRPLASMNWGDDEYPHFSFKPASQDHVRWLVTTWKDLVGAQAVQTTSEDEAYLRKLLEMPARDIKPEDEQDDALASDSTAAFDSGQISAMLDILSKVSDKTIPKETAIQLLMQAFPLTEEDAGAMVNPIVPRDPPEPVIAGGKPNGANGAARKFHTPGGVDHDQTLHGAWATGLAGDVGALKGKHATPEQVVSMFVAQGVPAEKVAIREPTVEELVQSGFQTGNAWYDTGADTFVFTPSALSRYDVHKISTIVNHEVSHRWFTKAGGRNDTSPVGLFIRHNYGQLQAESRDISKYASYFWKTSPQPSANGEWASGYNYHSLAHATTEGLSEVRRTRGYEGRPTYQALDRLVHSEAERDGSWPRTVEEPD